MLMVFLPSFKAPSFGIEDYADGSSAELLTFPIGVIPHNTASCVRYPMQCHEHPTNEPLSRQLCHAKSKVTLLYRHILCAQGALLETRTSVKRFGKVVLEDFLESITGRLTSE